MSIKQKGGGSFGKSVFISRAQELLDAGYSKTETSRRLGVNHSRVCRAIESGKLEVYEAFDESHKEETYLNESPEWLIDEDKLEELLWTAYDKGLVNLHEFLLEDYSSVGRHVATKYGNFFNCIDFKDFLPLQNCLYKNCSTCGRSKCINDFSSREGKVFLFGLDSQCKSCVYERVQENLISNIKYREGLKEKQLKRKEIERLLPFDDSHTIEKHLLKLMNKCVLTGSEDAEIDHVIPLSIGHGGSICGNLILLRKDLNTSKFNRNIFDWFNANKARFNLSQERFDRLIEWLAAANDMSVEEYRDYVYWCHANPRSVDEIRALNDVGNHSTDEKEAVG